MSRERGMVKLVVFPTAEIESEHFMCKLVGARCHLLRNNVVKLNTISVR